MDPLTASGSNWKAICRSSRSPPGPQNPLGPRALYLGDTLYPIHGTNRPGSIGGAVSHGCFRMYNPHIIELYEKVQIGANVHVVP